MVRQTTPGCKLAGLIHRELTQDACLGQPQENQFFTPVCQNLKCLQRGLKWVLSLIPSRQYQFLLEAASLEGLLEVRKVPGSSPGGSREFAAGTALARIDLFINIRLD